MATIVNTPAATHEHYVEERPAAGTGMLLTGLLIVLLIIALLYYGLPLIRNYTAAPQINVPKQMDVNINTPQNGGGNPGANSGSAPQAPK